LPFNARLHWLVAAGTLVCVMACLLGRRALPRSPDHVPAAAPAAAAGPPRPASLLLVLRLLSCRHRIGAAGGRGSRLNHRSSLPLAQPFRLQPPPQTKTARSTGPPLLPRRVHRLPLPLLHPHHPRSTPLPPAAACPFIPAF
jgi:hypothetical protein